MMNRVRNAVPFAVTVGLLALAVGACKSASGSFVREADPDQSRATDAQGPTFSGTATPTETGITEGHLVGRPRVAVISDKLDDPKR